MTSQPTPALTDLFERIRADYSLLLDYKRHGQTLELLTGIPTLCQSLVSVFISFDGEKYIASDGGWIKLGLYTPLQSDNPALAESVAGEYRQYFGVKTTADADGHPYYYKTCGRPELLSSIVHDIGHYIAGHVNSYCIQLLLTTKSDE